MIVEPKTVAEFRVLVHILEGSVAVVFASSLVSLLYAVLRIRTKARRDRDRVPVVTAELSVALSDSLAPNLADSVETKQKAAAKPNDITKATAPGRQDPVTFPEKPLLGAQNAAVSGTSR